MPSSTWKEYGRLILSGLTRRFHERKDRDGTLKLTAMNVEDSGRGMLCFWRILDALHGCFPSYDGDSVFDSRFGYLLVHHEDFRYPLDAALSFDSVLCL
jgi:hypothetical protein